MSDQSYTGRARSRTTPKSVRRAERTAKAFIYGGGIGTILAVTLIFVFLIWVVAPLFLGGDLEERATHELTGGDQIVAMDVDEYRVLGWSLYRDGRIRLTRLDDGTAVEERKLLTGMPPTAWARTPNGKKIVLGFGDGTVRIGEIGFLTIFRERDQVPENLRGLEEGEIGAFENGIAQVTPEGQFRIVKLRLELGQPIQAADSGIRLIDFSVLPSDAESFAALTERGTLGIYTTEETENLLTGEVTFEVEELAVPFDPPPGRETPAFLRLAGTGNFLYLIWSDGYAIRFDARDEERAEATETIDLTQGTGTITRVQYMIGKTTLLIGTDTGSVQAWFPTRPEGAGTIDGVVTVKAHDMQGPPSPVTTLGASARSRLAVAGHADGTVRLLLVTAAAEVARVNNPTGTAIEAAVLTSKEDGIVAQTATQLMGWDLRAGHPDASFGALFGKVWYEGYPEPAYVWQSTGGTDDFEPKLGLMPLIFGTLKATIYSMLIALPIALLGALFTSEFLKPKARAPVKSVIELMASLPSVVLGFIAALVIAPFVQNLLPATLTTFMTVPLMLLLGARLWQMLPQRRALRWSGLIRLGFQGGALVLGVLLALALGPLFESLFFDGDIKLWLDGRGDELAGPWVFLLLPLSFAIVGILFAQFVNPWVRGVSSSWDRRTCALFDVGRLAVQIAGSIVLAVLLGNVLAGVGADPRGSIVGTYAQRNAMIVGFVMGFAIVPIIYTLAEDALSSVPSQLREGSLGTGATPWQTAVRIIVPTAMSGIFGAIMVGLGRAVGETMIVLMAAGNTPLMEWNAFNGFRTLSANIAVELPEAVRDSTHYRTLFLAGLVLFAMTFVINTFAEIVRRRFRKRYAEQL